MATQERGPFPFLDLPSELRINVYEFHIKDIQITMETLINNSALVQIAHVGALLRTCRQIRIEALGVFKTVRTFAFRGFDAFNRLCRLLPPLYLSMIRHITLEVPSGSVYAMVLPEIPTLQTLAVQVILSFRGEKDVTKGYLIYQNRDFAVGTEIDCDPDRRLNRPLLQQQTRCCWFGLRVDGFTVFDTMLWGPMVRYLLKIVRSSSGVIFNGT